MPVGILKRAGFSRLTGQAMAFKDVSGQRSRRAGNGTSVVWFRNDLRVADNEALLRAWQSSSVVLPVYVLDPRLFGSTHVFKFPKTGGNWVLQIHRLDKALDLLSLQNFLLPPFQFAKPSSFVVREFDLI